MILQPRQVPPVHPGILLGYPSIGGMNRETVAEYAPHYLLMVLLTFVAVGAVRSFVGELDLLFEILVVTVVVLLYFPIVRRLGIAPSHRSDR